MDNNIVETLLKQILEELSLLTVSTKTNAYQKFKEEFLTSELREKMYNSFDGERTLPEISKELECKLNTLQVFVQSLVEKDLVKAETTGKSRIISKSMSKIALYYAKAELGE